MSKTKAAEILGQKRKQYDKLMDQVNNIDEEMKDLELEVVRDLIKSGRWVFAWEDYTYIDKITKRTKEAIHCYGINLQYIDNDEDPQRVVYLDNDKHSIATIGGFWSIFVGKVKFCPREIIEDPEDFKFLSSLEMLIKHGISIERVKYCLPKGCSYGTAFPMAMINGKLCLIEGAVVDIHQVT